MREVLVFIKVLLEYTWSKILNYLLLFYLFLQNTLYLNISTFKIIPKTKDM